MVRLETRTSVSISFIWLNELVFVDIEIEAQDWENLYEQNYRAYYEAYLKSKELEE